MNEDYLWDKSGEPDPEIEQLEKTLSSLRFRVPAEPLALPALTQTPNRTFRLSFSPALAVAASLLILILAGGVWLSLRRTNSTDGQNTTADVAAPLEGKRPETMVSGPRPPIGPVNPGDPRAVTASVTAPHTVTPERVQGRDKHSRRVSAPRQEMVRNRRLKISPRQDELAREGEQAKAQLILALHIASDKLNAVQRKIQTNPGT